MESKNRAICCIGHITLDKIITPRHTVYMPGGTAFYFGHAMGRLDPADFQLVTSLGQSEMGAVEELERAGVRVKSLPSRRSVYFENKYGDNPDERTQRVLSKADPFTVDKLEGVDADIYHLGTLLADDFALDVIEYLSGKGRVSVDAQGYLREVVGENVHAIDWAGKESALKHIDILKANEHEMEVLTGSRSPREAAEILHAMGVKEVVLTFGSGGSLIYDGDEFYDIPAYKAPNVVDATGCGDTYMAGYLYRRSRGCGIMESGCFAAAMCTLKLGASGPFSATEEAVCEVMRRGLGGD